MTGVQIWDVDRLMAARVIADLGVEPTETSLTTVARHAADHRQDASFWAARRLQSTLMNRLSDCLRSIRRDHRTEWYDGFREAEACIATTPAAEALQITHSPPPTVAGIVRRKIREVKAAKTPL